MLRKAGTIAAGRQLTPLHHVDHVIGNLGQADQPIACQRGSRRHPKDRQDSGMLPQRVRGEGEEIAGLENGILDFIRCLHPLLAVCGRGKVKKPVVE